MTLLSDRLKNVKPSPTLAITAKAKALRAQGRDVIGLGSGEPDFDTPKHIKKAAIEALKEGFTKYTPVDGIPELKAAIIRKYHGECGLAYEPGQVVATVGGKQAFFNLALALVNPGDEVIIPAPYWVSYPDMTHIAEGKPVILPTQEKNGFKMTPEELEAAITPRTKLVVINSPSNPTGATYHREELEGIGQVLLRHPHVWAVTDDIYDKIVFDGLPFVNLVQAVPELQERTIILNGVSKSYSMTGWRIGFAVGPQPVIKAMTKIQSQSTSCATSFAQRGAATALSGSQKCIKPMLKAFHQRRTFVVKALNDMPGVSCLAPEGSFYAYPNIAGLIGTKADGQTIESSLDLAAYLLDHYDVAIVPGVAFGLDPYFRLSFATSMEDLEEAMTRIHRAAKRLLAGG
ncbi:MAG: pyridoxal phosphate-dependent aminotransferase [Magnetococcales bacterium]|nr:pyridoxal phosphate-dependent aminotransferase [Magnetococcales bacterium]